LFPQRKRSRSIGLVALVSHPRGSALRSRHFTFRLDYDLADPAYQQLDMVHDLVGLVGPAACVSSPMEFKLCKISRPILLTALFARKTAGIHGSTLIVKLRGRPVLYPDQHASRVSSDPLLPGPDRRTTIDTDHGRRKAFRPLK
jgi:hypothetical protein